MVQVAIIKIPTTASGWRQIELTLLERFVFLIRVAIKQNLSFADQ